MDEKPNRPIWQLHLSTAVVLMVVVALWLTLCFKIQTGRDASGLRGYGMPFPFCYVDELIHFKLEYAGLALDLVCVSILCVKIAQLCERQIQIRRGRKP